MAPIGKALSAVAAACVFGGAATAADNSRDADAAKAAVNALAGCWTGPGQVRGTATENDFVVTPRLDGKYMTFAVASRDAKNPYRAVVVIAWAGGRKLTSFWMDSFGGEYSSAGSGAVAEDGSLQITYPYPDGDFVNRFTRHGDGWTWVITERKPGKPDRSFASYDLSRAACKGKHIDF